MLKFSSATSESTLREAILESGHIIYEHHLVKVRERFMSGVYYVYC